MARRNLKRITNNRTDGVVVVFTNGTRIRIPPINFDQGSDASIENRSRPDLGVYFRRVQDAAGVNRIQVQVTVGESPNWDDTAGWYGSDEKILGRITGALRRALTAVGKALGIVRN